MPSLSPLSSLVCNLFTITHRTEKKSAQLNYFSHKLWKSANPGSLLLLTHSPGCLISLLTVPLNSTYKYMNLIHWNCWMKKINKLRDSAVPSYEIHLLYKHRRNTEWAFERKHDIFIREGYMLFSHVKRSALLWLHNKSRLSQRRLWQQRLSQSSFDATWEWRTIYLTGI